MKRQRKRGIVYYYHTGTGATSQSLPHETEGSSASMGATPARRSNALRNVFTVREQYAKSSHEHAIHSTLSVRHRQPLKMAHGSGTLASQPEDGPGLFHSAYRLPWFRQRALLQLVLGKTRDFN